VQYPQNPAPIAAPPLRSAGQRGKSQKFGLSARRYLIPKAVCCRHQKETTVSMVQAHSHQEQDQIHHADPPRSLAFGNVRRSSSALIPSRSTFLKREAAGVVSDGVLSIDGPLPWHFENSRCLSTRNTLPSYPMPASFRSKRPATGSRRWETGLSGVLDCPGAGLRMVRSLTCRSMSGFIDTRHQCDQIRSRRSCGIRLGSIVASHSF
jgi:hypothetical protein